MSLGPLPFGSIIFKSGLPFGNLLYLFRYDGENGLDGVLAVMRLAEVLGLFTKTGSARFLVWEGVCGDRVDFDVFLDESGVGFFVLGLGFVARCEGLGNLRRLGLLELCFFPPRIQLLRMTLERGPGRVSGIGLGCGKYGHGDRLVFRRHNLGHRLRRTCLRNGVLRHLD